MAKSKKKSTVPELQPAEHLAELEQAEIFPELESPPEAEEKRLSAAHARDLLSTRERIEKLPPESDFNGVGIA